ncbi:FAD-dependent monooxygenase, partial [Acinetobacter baumannii]
SPNRRAFDLSPCTGAAIAQDKLEPILREAARARGADIRLGVEMVSFTQDDNGISVRVRPRDGAPEYEIAADYMIAASGAESTIRDTLGITRNGVGH